MWIYEQASGRLYREDDPDTVYVGYAGFREGRNRPEMEAEVGLGPIPVGYYDVGAPYDTETHGPYVLRLTPAPENVMHGRAGFLMHGDSRVAPGTASHGCIVISKPARVAVWLSDDHWLRVVSGMEA